MPVAEGTYYADIVEAGCDELANDNRTPYVYIKIHVTHVAADAAWRSLTQPFGREVRLYMTDKSWKHSEKRLSALGFQGDFDAIKFSKTSAEFVCTHNPREGKVYEKWDVVGEWNIGERGHQGVSKDLIRKLNAQWKTGIGRAVSSPPDAGETTAAGQVPDNKPARESGVEITQASPPDSSPTSVLIAAAALATSGLDFPDSSPVRDEEVPE